MPVGFHALTVFGRTPAVRDGHFADRHGQRELSAAEFDARKFVGRKLCHLFAAVPVPAPQLFPAEEQRQLLLVLVG
jgi:hypothetical protein